MQKYELLKSDGLVDLLEEVNSTHGIVDVNGENFRWRHVALFEALQSIIISNERTEIHERICDSFDRMSEMSVGDVQHAKHYSMAGKWNEACDKYMESGNRGKPLVQLRRCSGLLRRSEKVPRSISEAIFEVEACLLYCIRLVSS